MKKNLLLGAMSLLATTLMAVPADQTPFTVVQSDGSVLTLKMVGDEFFHYYINVETGEKMQRIDNGDYTSISDAHFAQMVSVAQQRRAEQDQECANLLAQASATDAMKGNKKSLIILAQFQDVAFNFENAQSKINDQFNKIGYNEDGHIGSVHDFYYAQSYGQFNLTFDVVGPVTLSENMAYYGGNSGGSDQRPREMVKEACQLADQLVNFSDYDWDGNKVVEQVFIVYAGYGENYRGADSNTIWPHKWSLSGIGTLSLDDVTINTYACTSELYGLPSEELTLNGIGTACHELSHCLGFPDIYDTDYSGGIGMQYYDLMSQGNYNGPEGRGEVPAGFTAYERWCAGWITPTVLDEGTVVTDMPDLGSTGTAYVIYNPSNANEFLMLENRQANNWFRYFSSADSFYHGLFVTHIDYDATIWKNNKPNDDPAHQRVCWVPADASFGTYVEEDKDWDYNGSEIRGDCFGSQGNADALTAETHANVGGKWYTGTTDIKPITDIVESSDGKISFTFNGGNVVESYTFNDGEAYTAAAPTQVGTLTYKRTFSDTDLNALYVPFALNYNDWCEYADIYKINNIFESDENNDGIVDSWVLRVIKQKAGSSIKANTPCIIKPKLTGEMTLTLTNATLEKAQNKSIDCSSTDYKFVFTGTTQTTSIEADTYFFISTTSALQYSNKTVSLRPQRWYMGIYDKETYELVKPTDFNSNNSYQGASRQFLIVDDDADVTAIRTIETPVVTEQYFDLMGRPVTDSHRGFTLHQGEKTVIVK